MDICPNCGLPKEACICNELETTKQKITIHRTTRKFGKFVTEVRGLDSRVKEMAKKLKESLACGGTVKNNVIELQGDHMKKVKEKLMAFGFDKDNIEIA
jgi:translation initiation factor 1